VPWSEEQVARAHELLREVDRRWHRHGREGVGLTIPAELVSEVPSAPRHDRHVPRSRR
jgi:hypothetical protein